MHYTYIVYRYTTAQILLGLRFTKYEIIFFFLYALKFMLNM